MVAGDGSNVELLAGSSVNFITGNTITFLPGFHANEGSFVHGYITTESIFCDGSFQSIAASPELKSQMVSVNYIDISNDSEIKSVKIIPNPNSGSFTLESSSLILVSPILVYNLIGELVYHGYITSKREQKVYIPSLDNGFYVVKITNGKVYFAQKMVISH